MLNAKRQASRMVPLAFFLAMSWSAAKPATAQIIVPVQDQSQVDVTISVDVQFDTATDLYTYTYELTNGLAAPQEVHTLSIEADAEVLNVQSPQGWSAGLFFDKPILHWGATELGPLPPDFVDDGNIPPSAFNIKPGQTLGGFSLQSPEPPTTVLFFSQGYAPLPSALSEDDFDGIEIPLYTENSFIDFTVGPGLDDGIIFAGGRRPSVDGFLAFVGLAGDRETLLRPVTMVIRFGVNGESVNTSTFHAELNRVDVTGVFEATGNGDEMLAVFEIGSSPLEIGRNALTTSVEGTVPGTMRTAADTDRLTFFVD